MRIGIDFDNTIICYDLIFHKIALEQGLIRHEFPKNKGMVRDFLRAQGKEDIWTEMQGYVYGARLREAEPFPGVFEFFKFCRENDIITYIISHKTRYPYVGEKYDLHAAAYAWLKSQGCFNSNTINLQKDKIFFELTKIEKMNRIRSLQCTHFIDDLPEFLADPRFPEKVHRILFDPNQNHLSGHGFCRVSNWGELIGLARDKQITSNSIM